MTRKESTAALVAAARAGDRDAFGVLAARCYPMVVATCARFLGDADLALDVIQEAVVTAMLSLDRLRDGERFGAWVIGTALNLCRRPGPGEVPGRHRPYARYVAIMVMRGGRHRSRRGGGGGLAARDWGGTAADRRPVAGSPAGVPAR